jgi:hypothetical protein
LCFNIRCARLKPGGWVSWHFIHAASPDHSNQKTSHSSIIATPDVCNHVQVDPAPSAMRIFRIEFIASAMPGYNFVVFFLGC